MSDVVLPEVTESATVQGLAPAARLPGLRLEIALGLALVISYYPLAPLFVSDGAFFPLDGTIEGTLSDASLLLQVVFFAWFCLRVRGEHSSTFRLSKFEPKIDLGFGLFLLFVMYVPAVLVMYLQYSFEFLRPEIVYVPMQSAAEVCLLLIGVACTSVAEEIYYRGALLSRLETYGNSKGRALFWSSLCFGLAHTYQGPFGVLGIFLMGLILGAFVQMLGRVWPAAVGHVLYNFYCVAISLE